MYSFLLPKDLISLRFRERKREREADWCSSLEHFLPGACPSWQGWHKSAVKCGVRAVRVRATGTRRYADEYRRTTPGPQQPGLDPKGSGWSSGRAARWIPTGSGGGAAREKGAGVKEWRRPAGTCVPSEWRLWDGEDRPSRGPVHAALLAPRHRPRQLLNECLPDRKDAVVGHW